MNSVISQVTFWASFASASLIFLFALASVLLPNFQFWPPPDGNSWQHRIFMLLFRGYLYPLIILTALQFEFLEGTRGFLQYGAGALLLLTGFGLAFRITFDMGWRNAFGEKRGLRTTGWFAKSRNTIYVVTWIGLLGWALIANSLSVTILLSIWALLYLLAPILEEPWLEKEYGAEYTEYKRETPRFV